MKAVLSNQKATKENIGLGNVDNTSDLDKPISTATQEALDGKLSLTGGTMTGNLTLANDPTEELEAATKGYVDTQLATVDVDAYTKEETLTDTVRDLLGLDDTDTPADAFLQLALPDGKYAVQVTVLSPGGLAMSDITISELETSAGNEVVTNSNGTALGFISSTSSEITLTAINDCLDISGDKSITATLTSGVINEITIQFERGTITEKTFSTSATVKLSPDVATYNASAIGGGANGGTGSSGYNTSSYSTAWTQATGGKGGNAGELVNMADITNDGNSFDIVVGGIGGTSKIGTIITATGAGGATGGSGAYAYVNSYSSGTNWYKNTDASDGGDTDSFLYPETTVGGAGGGGAAYAQVDKSDEDSRSASADWGSGGSPGGGSGYYSSSNVSKSGSYPGAGGGGARRYQSGSYSLIGTAGSGVAGLCGLTWSYIN